MANSMHDSARKSQGDKLGAMIGDRGEYAPDRAERIAGVKANASAAQGDSAQMPEEVFTGAPARQVSNYGKVRK